MFIWIRLKRLYKFCNDNQCSAYDAFAFITGIILISQGITPIQHYNKDIIIKYITNRTLLHIDFLVLSEYWVRYHQKEVLQAKYHQLWSIFWFF